MEDKTIEVGVVLYIAAWLLCTFVFLVAFEMCAP